MHRSVCLKLITLDLGVKIKNIAEVGVWLGETSYFFAKFFPEAHLYLVDSWKPTPDYLERGQAPSFSQKDYDGAHKNVVRLFNDNPQVSILTKTSHEALSHVPNNLDLVFIDGQRQIVGADQHQTTARGITVITQPAWQPTRHDRRPGAGHQNHQVNQAFEDAGVRRLTL